MSKHPHTPGPWQLEENGPCWDLYAPTVRSERHCILVGMTYLDADEHSSNARLIVAAPDLLLALEELAVLGEKGMKPNPAKWITFHDKVAQIACAAIAKAKGE